MKSFILDLDSKLTQELEGLPSESNPIIRFDRSRRLCKSTIDELRKYVAEYSFADKVEEIAYFRDLAPPLYSRFFYFNRLLQVEFRTFGLDKEKHLAALAEELERTERFFRVNAGFIEYHYSGNGDHDEQWFVRNAAGYCVPGEMTVVLDRYYPLGCYLVSKLLAHQRAKDWLKARLLMLQDEGAQWEKPFSAARYEFEGTIADIGELIDAFSSKKLIKVNGKPLDTKSLTSLFELVFLRKVGNIYDVIHSNRNRKKDPTPFLHSLMVAVQKHSG